MATQLKEVRLRIASIKKTLQITKAMKMASVNKLKKTQNILYNFEPYAQTAKRILTNLTLEYPQALDQYLNIYKLNKKPQLNSVLIVVISSDKGLCGGYNNNLFKKIYSKINSAPNSTAKILNIGKKAGEFFQRQNISVINDFQELYHSPQDKLIAQLAKYLLQAYIDGEYVKIFLAYTHFINSIIQVPVIQEILPLNLTDSIEQKDFKKVAINYEDTVEYCASNLLRIYLNASFYHAILDAQVAEHSARINAMEQANENANKISEHLKISYNRARQSLITKEVIEIISGSSSF